MSVDHLIDALSRTCADRYELGSMVLRDVRRARDPFVVCHLRGGYQIGYSLYQWRLEPTPTGPFLGPRLRLVVLDDVVQGWSRRAGGKLVRARSPSRMLRRWGKQVAAGRARGIGGAG